MAPTKKQYGISSLGKDFMTKAQRLSNFDSTNSSVNRYFVKSGQDFGLPPLFLQEKHTVDSNRRNTLITFSSSQRKETNKKPLNRHTISEITILLIWAP